jgi:8-oxo-dGTP pyrophosphatase MutT (NUDIX family)
VAGTLSAGAILARNARVVGVGKKSREIAMVIEAAHPEASIRPGQSVVAIVIEWRGRIALFRRSRNLAHDSGLWHCITGYIESAMTPARQAVCEIFEETGLQANDLVEFKQGPTLVIYDLNSPWRVHTFLVKTVRKRLIIDWEHDAYRWVDRHKLKRFSNRVAWLDDVLDATLPATRKTGRNK